MLKKKVFVLLASLALLGFGVTCWASPDHNDYFHYDTAFGVGGGHEGAAYTSSAGSISRLVFQQIVLPSAQTNAEKEAAKRGKLPGSFGASAYWEGYDFEDAGEEGDIYGLNVGAAIDYDGLTYGVMLPYDYIDFDSFDGYRVGLVGFTKYTASIDSEWAASFSGHLNYCYTDLDFDFAGSEDLSTYGGGVGAAITYDQDVYFFSFGSSYFYNTDDSDAKEDKQHLIKTGINTGVRTNDTSVISVFAVWNVDITDYDNDPEDDDYFEVGFEGALNLSDTFGINLGYKKVVDLDDFDADQVYLGSIWKF